MSHDAGEFRLFLGAQNQTAVDVEKSAGKREGVDFIRVDDLDGEGNSRVGIANQVLANAIDVFGDDGIVYQFRRTFDFLGQRFAEADFALDGLKIYALADVAIADRFDVILTVLGVDGVGRSDGSVLARLAFFVLRFGLSWRLGGRVLRRRLGGRRRDGRSGLSRRGLSLSGGGSGGEQSGEKRG